MTSKFNPEMLILGREARGWTQKELAEKSGLAQGNISKHENGIQEPEQENLARIALNLRYPTKFFYIAAHRYRFGSSCTYHRKRETALTSDLTTLLAQLNLFRIRVGLLLTNVELAAPNEIRKFDIDRHDYDIKDIAHTTRTFWRLPRGPVRNVVEAIENAGGIVYCCRFGTPKIDALSQWIPPDPPIFFVNSDSPGDRARYSLSHELGHVIAHEYPTENQEREADQFAAEFLMPAEDISESLEGLTLPKAARLKSDWKVSMAALIRRAHDLKRISDNQYKALFIQLSKMGYRTVEPNPIPMDKPSVLDRLLNFHINDLGYSSADLGELLAMDVEEVESTLLPQEGKPTLKMV